MYLFYAISSLIYRVNRVSAIRGRVRGGASVNRANARRQESLCRPEDNARDVLKATVLPAFRSSLSEDEGFSRYYKLFSFYFASRRKTKLDVLLEAATKIKANGVIDGIIHGSPSTVVDS